jgi:hypothetical protein
VRREDGFDAHGGDQRQHLIERKSLAPQACDAIRDPAGLGRARVVEVLPAAAHAVHFLGGIDRLKPEGERARQVVGGRGRAAGGAPLQFGILGFHTLAPRDGRETIAFHDLEELLAALFEQGLADEGTERVHVLAQPDVLGGKLNVFTIRRAHRREAPSENSAIPWYRNSRNS